MNAVHSVGLIAFQQMDQVAGTTDACYHDVVFHGQTGLFQPVNHGEFQCPAHAEVTAAGTPFEIVFRVLLAHTATASVDRVLVISVICSTRVRALKGNPVYWVMDSALTPRPRRMVENWP